MLGFGTGEGVAATACWTPWASSPPKASATVASTRTARRGSVAPLIARRRVPSCGVPSCLFRFASPEERDPLLTFGSRYRDVPPRPSVEPRFARSAHSRVRNGLGALSLEGSLRTRCAPSSPFEEPGRVHVTPDEAWFGGRLRGCRQCLDPRSRRTREPAREQL